MISQKPKVYIVQVVSSGATGFLHINPGTASFVLVPTKNQATRWASKVLAHGWLNKAKHLYRAAKVTVIAL